MLVGEGETKSVYMCVHILDWGWSRGPTVSVAEEQMQEPEEGLQSSVAQDTGLDNLVVDPSSGQKHLIYKNK